MQITVKLANILPKQSGTGKNGEWKKQDLVFETQDQFPKKICISFWGDKLQNISLRESETFTIDFDVESREYNGKWFTDLKGWKIVQISDYTDDHTTNSKTILKDIDKNSVFTEEEDDFPF
ncbi:DUF3127 domain-containing protein [Kaistella jeonii]|uniref:DUF3127 domain-containing protein n=1 Tax=Kaistella jeonii TaxID=266749 RepID=A0A0C1F8Y4_9FLAO|nr:DUF3127 domain-containing protein [Kaistella jeonii]KIA89592.1 hypothetical protein OA86_02870 [Kaistella jeonii]SFB90325.1 protein of unknown function [Kaistella jeonii]VEI95801.1 Domain of uncharacterised function (DUF3127) [Kaistella jeonii]